MQDELSDALSRRRFLAASAGTALAMPLAGVAPGAARAADEKPARTRRPA